MAAEIAPLYDVVTIPPHARQRKVRVHAPNPKRIPRDQIFHACGACGHGGGTLKRTHECDSACALPCPLIQTYRYDHTERRFCLQYHVPKKLLAPIVLISRRERTRQRQEFHRTGTIRRMKEQHQHQKAV